MRAVLAMTLCSRRGCGQCGQVCPIETTPDENCPQAWGKALLRNIWNGFPSFDLPRLIDVPQQSPIPPFSVF